MATKSFKDYIRDIAEKVRARLAAQQAAAQAAGNNDEQTEDKPTEK